jgi:hypothetical protein
MAGGGSIGGDSGEMGDGRAIEGFGWKNRERLHWTIRLRPRLERFGLGIVECVPEAAGSEKCGRLGHRSITGVRHVTLSPRLDSIVSLDRVNLDLYATLLLILLVDTLYRSNSPSRSTTCQIESPDIQVYVKVVLS